MSDERLRELERRWKETGVKDDYLTYLAERVRLGQEPRFGVYTAGSGPDCLEEVMFNLPKFQGRPRPLSVAETLDALVTSALTRKLNRLGLFMGVKSTCSSFIRAPDCDEMKILQVNPSLARWQSDVGRKEYGGIAGSVVDMSGYVSNIKPLKPIEELRSEPLLHAVCAGNTLLVTLFCDVVEQEFSDRLYVDLFVDRSGPRDHFRHLSVGFKYCEVEHHPTLLIGAYSLPPRYVVPTLSGASS